MWFLPLALFHTERSWHAYSFSPLVQDLSFLSFILSFFKEFVMPKSFKFERTLFLWWVQLSIYAADHIISIISILSWQRWIRFADLAGNQLLINLKRVIDLKITCWNSQIPRARLGVSLSVPLFSLEVYLRTLNSLYLERHFGIVAGNKN